MISLELILSLQMTNPVIKIVPFHVLHLKKGEQIYLININLVPLNSRFITSLGELTAHRHEALANLPLKYYDYTKSIFNEVEPT